MNKIAITSEGPSLDDQVDPRFGRAAGFVLVDLDTMDTQYIDNGQSQVLAQGAGIQASQIIARAGASWLLTGYVGPKAFKVLAAAGIKVGQNLEGLTVREVVERFKGGLSSGSNGQSGRSMIVAVASGKGGTGKTTVTASLAAVWNGPLVAVDLDVEEPNLHLFLHPDIDGSDVAHLLVPAVDETEMHSLRGLRRALPVCRHHRHGRVNLNVSRDVSRVRRLSGRLS